MIKVRLRLNLHLDEEWDDELEEDVPKDQLVKYDKETWKDGNVFEFPDLKSAEEFRLSCPIDFKPEVYKNDSQWTYHTVETEFFIDADNDELVLVVNAGEDWED